MAGLTAIVDIFAEVSGSMGRNKLRVALTGCSIAFGIFMLIVLLASGNGLLNGIQDRFGGNTNNMEFWGGWTSKAWRGLPRGRHIRLNNERMMRVLAQFPEYIEAYSPIISNEGLTMNVGTRNRSTELNGVNEEQLKLRNLKIAAGRWINQMDNRQRRKVVVIDKNAAEVLFPGLTLDECIGRWVTIGSLNYKLVGVYTSSGNRGDNRQAFCPFATMATIYSGRNYDMSNATISLRGLETPEAIEAFQQQLRRAFANMEDFDPTDRRAFGMWTMADDYLEMLKMLKGMRLFIWIIGIASLVAGVVGISNIMLITVRERTREFGIRKAIGARPRSIVFLVLSESVAITLLFGYIGMLLGIGLVDVVDRFVLSSAGDGPMIFRNPSVDMGVVLMATAVMVVAGVIAGYMPTRRAMSIKPIEALSAN